MVFVVRIFHLTEFESPLGYKVATGPGADAPGTVAGNGNGNGNGNLNDKQQTTKTEKRYENV